MRFSVVLCVLLVYAAFSERALAQTYTPGELRATAIVAGAQDRADAIRRRLDAPTLTPRPTLTATDTPAPTNTSTPSPAPTETTKPTTPAPMDAPTATQVVATITLMSAPTAQTEAPKSGADVGQAALILVLGLVTMAGFVALYRFIVGRTEIR